MMFYISMLTVNLVISGWPSARALSVAALRATILVSKVGLLLESHRLRGRLVHRSRVNYVLEVLGHVSITMVTQLLNYFQAVEKGTIVAHTCLPLRDTDSIV